MILPGSAFSEQEERSKRLVTDRRLQSRSVGERPGREADRPIDEIDGLVTG